MRFHRLVTVALLGAAPLLTEAAAPTTPFVDPAPGDRLGPVVRDTTVPEEGEDDPILPLKIPGYELKVLDVRKAVRFRVAGAWVQAELPIFFYFPLSPSPLAAQLLRQTYGDLLKLGHKPEWSAAELQAVMIHLDAVIRLLDAPAAPKEVPAPKT